MDMKAKGDDGGRENVGDGGKTFACGESARESEGKIATLWDSSLVCIHIVVVFRLARWSRGTTRGRGCRMVQIVTLWL